ncbi:MAG: hypothetical protein GC162_20405 [Planctomycetes bacterium]|nr:hypothetical protein [Planctomycetota bacterium]
MLTLYTNYFTHASAARRADLDFCFSRNLENPWIDRLVVISQATPEEIAKFSTNPKVVVVNLDCGKNPYRRPTFRNYFDLVNQFTTSPNDLNIVANSDIYFDDSLAMIQGLDLNNVCLALTRWEHRDNGEHVLEIHEDWSQDAWIFQGRVRPMGHLDFPMGIWGCDNRLAWQLYRDDYLAANPCFDVKAIHMHASGVRFNGTRVEGPTDTVGRCSLADCGLHRGTPDSGVISFSLWGDKRHYLWGAVANAKLARHVYPGWTMRVYHDESVPKDILQTLFKLKVDLVEMPPNRGISGMFWRFLAAADRGFSRWLVRDCDSRLTYRERAAVDEWVRSGAPFHVMRDHPDHAAPILGGMFGGTSTSVPQMPDWVEAWAAKDCYGQDQDFLKAIVWPKVRATALVHDAFAETYTDLVRMFPTPRENYHFVGERCDEDEHWHLGNRKKLMVAEARRLRIDPGRRLASPIAPTR